MPSTSTLAAVAMPTILMEQRLYCRTGSMSLAFPKPFLCPTTIANSICKCSGRSMQQLNGLNEVGLARSIRANQDIKRGEGNRLGPWRERQEPIQLQR